MEKHMHPLTDVLEQNRADGRQGIYSICSAHPHVLDASLLFARDNGEPLCLETTSNQVNQFGGYTGMTPETFAAMVHKRAVRIGLNPELIWLGGDHLGPFPWRAEPAEAAMQKAVDLVRRCVDAGYRKIHLDTSMACADDPPGPTGVAGFLAEAETAERTAVMAAAAELAFDAAGMPGPRPVYVVGTEVPSPGGHQGDGEDEELHITTPSEAENTIGTMRAAFGRHGLETAWDRVRALVVQPGVEFGDTTIHRYDPAATAQLSGVLEAFPGLVYEAHSTDYQDESALRALVENHFAILKVGPWLTFNLREALFSLSFIEDELIPTHGGLEPSGFRETLVDVALSDPRHWQSYYSGTTKEIVHALKYSLSDRIRYYWTNARIAASLDRLTLNLEQTGIPRALARQFFPDIHSDAIGEMTPQNLITARIQQVNAAYSRACSGLSGRGIIT
jgi:D-tagatose-1,6-bisphosphate aldolase subunit GatZ/KbaZ